MKKIICLILICLMLPITSILVVGCKNKDYKLKEFYTSYQNIGNNLSNLTLVDATDIYGLNTTSYKITINYTKLSTLSTLVEKSNTPYYKLKYFYQQLLDDTLSPMYFFGSSIANSKKVSDKQTESLFKSLKNLELEYKDIDFYVGILNTSLITNDVTIISNNLKNVFEQYEQTIEAAINLANIVNKVYFDKIVVNENYNHANKPYNQLTESDIAILSSDIRARMYYYKSVYANVYYQMCVKGNNLGDKFISNISPSTTYTPYNQIKAITTLDSVQPSVLVTNEQALYNIHSYASSLYNLQNNFDEAYENFNLASSKVTYSKLTEDSSVTDLNYGTIIYQFANGIAVDSWEILNSLTNLLYV